MTDSLSFLMEHGLPLEEIERLKKRYNWTLDQLAEAAESIISRGESITASLGISPQDDVPSAPALIRACDVPYEPPRWTIAPYIQRGKGTLIQADNGIGKTAFVCAIAAHVTTGKPLLGIPITAPGDVLILSVEDDLPITAAAQG